MRHFKRSAPLWAVLAFCTSASSFSQVPAPAAPSYAAESAVIRSAHVVFDMQADGTGTRDETLAITLQSEAALRQLGVISVPFASASDKVEFRYVRVRRPDGSVIDTPLDGVQEQAEQVTREAPFYSDLKQKQLPVKGLHVGDTLEWQVHVTHFKAEAPNQFWGNSSFYRDAVVLAEHIELRVPTASHATVWTNPELAVKPTESTVGTQHIYSWDWKHLEPTVGPAAEAAAKEKKKKPLTPEELQDAEQGRLPDVSWTTFSNWEAVGAWYRSLEATRMQPDDTIKAKVAEITAGKATQEEKVKAVYAWVSGQIRYIGVALGVGRFQPHTASVVLDNQYGDCKDKHTLLASMLLALGLHPDAVLLGAGVRFNDAVPSPGSFNHLITSVQLDGKRIWLDSTAEVAPFRVLLPPERNKQVLVVPSEGPAVVERTPSAYPYTAFASMSATSSLDKDLTSDSKIVFTFRDDDEVALRSVLRQVSPAQYSQLVQNLMSGMGFGGTTSDPEIDHADDTSQPLTISFHYHRVKEANWGENRVTVPFMLISLPTVDEKDPPVSPFALGILRTETSTIEIKLPEGWNAELPEAVHAHSPYADCDITYRLDKGVFHAERRLTVLKEKVPAADWKQYKAWYEEASADSVPYLQLTHATHHALSSPSGSHSASNAEAARLVSKAWEELQAGKNDEAETDLLGAQQLNPHEEALLGDLGLVAWRKKNYPEAMRDYQQEIDYHPESSFAWESLARLQNLTGDRKAAIKTLTKWSISAPGKPEPATDLLRFFLDTKDYAGALSAGNDALKRLTPNAQQDEFFQLALGLAQLHGGATEAGVATLSAIATNSTNPGLRNDAAYELASAHQQLPLAESTERAVITQAAARTTSWTGDESPATLHGQTGLLAASWDTMGWILFAENKLPEAEGFIRAAWHNHQSADIAEHLGDIEMAGNHPVEALRFYREAVALSARATMVNGKLKLSESKTPLDAKIAKAKAAYGKDEPFDAQQVLQNSRTIPLSASSLTGTAEYRLLLSPHGIEHIALVGEKDLKGAEELIHKAKLPNFFPPSVDARVVHSVILNCSAGFCSLIVEP